MANPKRTLKSLAVLTLLFAAPVEAQQFVYNTPDCQFFFQFTTTGQSSPTSPNAGLDNRTLGCTTWQLNYNVSGFSGVSVAVQSAPDSSGSPGSYSNGFAIQQNVITGSNPGTSTTGGYWWANGYGAWVQVKLVSSTGSGTVTGTLYGWRIPGASGSTPTTAPTAVPPYNYTNQIANTVFVQQAVDASMGTVPLANITGGTYSFASLGSGATINFTATSGVITSINTIYTGGSGYAVGDLLTIGYTASVLGNDDAVLRVATVSGTGIASLTILYGGTGYNSGTNVGTFNAYTIPFTYELSGTLSSNATFIMPNGPNLLLSNQWIIANNTTGAYTITFFISNGSDATTGNGVVIPQGTNNNNGIFVYTDGFTDMWAVAPNSATCSSATSLGFQLIGNDESALLKTTVAAWYDSGIGGCMIINQGKFLRADSQITVPPSTTFASPPPSPPTGLTRLFLDASTDGTCSGGGTGQAQCTWNGSAWVSASPWHMPTMTILGTGSYQATADSVGPYPANTSGLDLRYNGNRLVVVGQGTFRLQDLTIRNGGTNCGTFVFSTLASMQIERNSFYGSSSNSGTSACEIGWKAGGTNLANGTLYGSFQDYFQGYQSDFSQNFGDYIQSILLGQSGFNATTVIGNKVWKHSGSSSSSIGGINISGLWSANPATGNTITGNVVEMDGYYWGYTFSDASYNRIESACFDTGLNLVGCFTFDANSNYNYVNPFQGGSTIVVNDSSGYNRTVLYNQTNAGLVIISPSANNSIWLRTPHANTNGATLTLNSNYDSGSGSTPYNASFNVADNGTVQIFNNTAGDFYIGEASTGAILIKQDSIFPLVINGGNVELDNAATNLIFAAGKGQHIQTDAAASDLSGTCTFSSYTCTLNFTSPYASAPSCTANDQTAIAPVKVAPGTSSVTFSSSLAAGAGSSDVIAFHCIGNPN